ncbi:MULTISPECIES: hypothetical protein [Flavobacterium]|uniref:Uncharacterized protein n=1 Tax=Flavobacterium jumunjinense TaxID=998845 RepID=A0ABV5GUD9_9FLAO|nr:MULTISPECIES: hypothetical protein [Flavobacterium]
MFAETVHTIYKSLPDAERERFMVMMQKEMQAREKPKKKVRVSNVPTVEEYIDIAYAVMNRRKTSIKQ